MTSSALILFLLFFYCRERIFRFRIIDFSNQFFATFLTDVVSDHVTIDLRPRNKTICFDKNFRKTKKNFLHRFTFWQRNVYDLSSNLKFKLEFYFQKRNYALVVIFKILLFFDQGANEVWTNSIEINGTFSR